MPALPEKRLLEILLDAVRRSGGEAALLLEPGTRHPRKFRVRVNDEAFHLWVYAWTVTHGGGSGRPAEEYRIQMTTVEPPLRECTRGHTLLLGYDAALEVFAGFDFVAHRQFTPGSPSVQIRRAAMLDAQQRGLGFSLKANGEIAVAFRPEFLLLYARYRDEIHHSADPEGLIREMLGVAEAAFSEEPEAPIIGRVPPERRRLVTETSRLSRDSAFARRVLEAYQNRCAITRLQLRLVDAAHIVPVAHEDSTDDVTNGLALSPTLHRAFDNGLIYIDPSSFRPRINPRRRADLAKDNLVAGLDYLVSLTDAPILLPSVRASRPDPDLIRLANKVRMIPGY